MALSDQDKKLLNDIFTASLKSPNGVDAARFRADNENFMTELDDLERHGYVQRSNNLYFIPLITLTYLAKENPDAQSIVQKCGFVFALLRGYYKDNIGKHITVLDIAKNTGLSVDDVGTTLVFIRQASILGTFSPDIDIKNTSVVPSESILKYKKFEDILKEREEWDKYRQNQHRASKKLNHPTEQEASLSVTSSKENWRDISRQFGITKNRFGRRINFVKDPFKKTIIFRDVEQAFILASSGFSKPAVILAGGVIEELLRLYLKYKKIPPLSENFDGYIKTCEQHGLLKDSVSRLSHSVRQFRNLVHLSAEQTKKHTISKATAIGAVSSIFTIASDF